MADVHSLAKHNAVAELLGSPVPGGTKALFRAGTGAPSGTPDAYFYVRTDGTTTTTVVYVDVNGTWTALTIA